MPNPPRKLAHVGIAVYSLEEALPFYRDSLGLAVREILDLPERGMRIAMMPCGETVLELMEPTGANSEIAGFLERRGPGIHHLCLEVDDIESRLGELRDSGVRLVNQEAEVGAEGCPVAFIHPAAGGGILFELLEDV